jgi:hypothetical protein
VYKEGGEAPPLRKKGAPANFLRGFLIPKILTEFSFGIGMVNTEKYRQIPTKKY